jgi:hypothetical protein
MGEHNLLKLFAGQPLAQHVELVEAAIFKGHGARTARPLMSDSHLQAQKITQMLFNRADIGIAG